MSGRTRRRFTAEYKAESVKFYEESGRYLQSFAVINGLPQVKTN